MAAWYVLRLSQIARKHIPSSVQKHFIYNSTGGSRGSLTNIVNILPPEPDLQIGILCDHAGDFLDEVVALLHRDVVYLLEMGADGEDALPAGGGICAYGRMDGCHVGADVKG